MTASRSAAEIFEGAGKPAFVRGYKRSKLDRVSKRRSIESRSDPLNERRGMTVLSRCTPTNQAPCNGRTLQGPKSSKVSPTGVGSRVLWAGSIQIFGGLRSPRSRDKSCCCSIRLSLRRSPSTECSGDGQTHGAHNSSFFAASRFFFLFFSCFSRVARCFCFFGFASSGVASSGFLSLRGPSGIRSARPCFFRCSRCS